jgi:hypothetical protein
MEFQPTVSGQIEVPNELENLGVCIQGITRAVDAMVLAKLNSTANDIAAAGGTRAFLDGIRALAEFYGKQGWDLCENGVPSIYNRDRKIRIAVCNTDDATGLDVPGRVPKSRNKRGPATDKAIHSSQGLLFNWEEENFSPMNSGEVQQWFLCVYCEGEEYRAELSHPAKCESGFFTSFHKRIILVGEGADSHDALATPKGGVDSDSEFEITVERKQA